jgi:uncharacterized cupin superfamily protein
VSGLPVVNALNVELEDGADRPEGYRRRARRLGPLIGAQRLGATVYELDPGESICPYHYELGDEEWLLVLSGRPTLRTPQGEEPTQEGDLVCFPAGPEGAHKLTNETRQTVRLMLLSTLIEPAVSVYPDSGKVGVWPPGLMFRQADAVDYWEGEVSGRRAE